MANAQINIGVAYNLDQRSYNAIMKSLNDLDTKAKAVMNNKESDNSMKQQFQEAASEAKKLKTILENSWDNKLGQLNLTQFNSQLTKANTTATQFYDKLAKGGTEGRKAADAFARSILDTNIELTKSNKLLDKMAVTFGNTIRYGISSSIFNTVTNAIRNAYEYSKQLDTSLNDIRIVSGKSALEMEKFAENANKAAQNLGKSTLDYTKAATIFYQQGLDTNEVEKRTEIVLKAANVTGQTASEVSEQLTSVWNGYQVGIGELESYVDKLSAVAAKSASNLEELSTGMSKVASAANVMGVDIDQLTAQMSTIISVTRQAPESVGTALRTIYARMADIKAGMDDEITLGNYSGKMKKLGFEVLDANGNLKDMGNVIEEIGFKWKDLTREQQVSLAQVMAGTRQYNNLLTLFDNWNKYTNALETSQNAAGKLQEQQDIYMESTEAHLKQLQTTAEDLYATLFDQDMVKGFIDTLNLGLKSLTQYAKSLGGGINSFLGIGSHLVGIFNNKISEKISEKRERKQSREEANALMNDHAEIANRVRQAHAERGEKISESAAGLEAKWTQKILEVKEHLTEEEFKQLNLHKQRIGLIKDEVDALDEEYTQIQLNLQKQEKYYKLDENGKPIQVVDETWQKAQGVFHKYGAAFKADNDDNGLNVNDADSLSKFLAYMNKHSSASNEEEIQTEEDINELLLQRIEYLKQANENRNKRKQLGKEEKAHEQDITGTVKKGKDRGDTQKTVKGAAAALQATTALVGMVKVLSSESATAEDRASAMFNGILGGAASAISMVNPMAGMIAQLGIGLLDTLGVSKLFAAALETESERATRIAKEANEAYEEQAQRVKEVESSVENLQSAFDQYDKALDHVDNLTKGTEEWEEAVYKVNQQVLDLMEKFPQLAQYVKEVNGVLTIDKEGYQEVLKEQKLMLAQDRQAAAAAKLGANYANQNSLYTNYGDTLKDTLANTGSIGNYASAEALGKAVLSIYRENADLLTKDTSEIAELLEKQLGSVFSDAEIDAIANEIKNNSNNLKNLDASVKSLDDSTKVLAKQFASGYIDAFGNKTLSDSAYKSILSDSIADIYDTEEYKKWFKENYDENSDSAKVDSTVGKDYVKYVRKNWTYKKQDDEGYIYFADENGQEVKMADETVRSAVGQKVYADKYFNEETLTKKNEELLKVQNELMETLSTDKETAEQLINSMASGNSIDFSLLNNDQINKFGAWAASTDWNRADLFNYESNGLTGAAWYSQYQKSLTSEELVKNAKNRGERYSKSAGKMQDALNVLSTGDTEELTEEQLSYLDKLEDKYKELGEIKDRTSAEYLEKLREIKEQEEANSYAALNDAKERQRQIVMDLYEKLEKLKESGATTEEIKAKTDEFEKAMEELESVDHSIQVQVEADLANDVEDAFGLARQFDQLRTKVGQSLELTFDEAQELIKNGYGEILTNAQETANATIKLDRDTVNSFIDSKQTQLKADKDAKIKQLENQRALLVAQEKALEQEVNAYTAALEAKDEGSAAEALNEATNAHKVYEAKVDELNNQVQAEADAANETQNIDSDLYTALGGMAETNEQNTEDASAAGADAENQNAQQRWKAIKNVYDAWVAVGKANAQSANGEVSASYPPYNGAGGVKPGGFSAASTEGNKTTFNPKQLTAEDLKDYFNNGESSQAYKATIEKLRSTAQAQLNSVRKQIGSIDAGIAALKSADASLDKYQGDLGKSKNKGGGGGGNKDAKSKDPNQDELDRYQLVNVQLKEISKELSKLEKQKSKLFGGKLIENLNKQVKILNDQITVTERKLAIAQQEQDEIAATLLGYGISFDSDGNIANYAQVFAQQQANLNAVYATYNSMSADAQDAYEDTVKAAEESWNNFKESISKYDNLIGETIPQLYQDIQDAFDQQTEIFIEEFNMEIKLRLDTSSMMRDWNEFRRKVIDGIKDDDILGVAGAKLKDFNSYYNEDKTGEIQALTKQLQGQLEEAMAQDATGSAEWYRDNRAKALEDLKSNYDKIKQSLLDIVKLEEDMQQKVIDMLKETQSGFDEQVTNFENINKQLEHNIELINLLTDEDDYESLAKQYEAEAQNRKQELDFYTQQKDFWDYYLNEVLEKGTKEWDEAKAKYDAAAEAWSGALKDTIETARKEFENNIKLIFKTINNQLTNNKGLEYLNTEWELLATNSDMVLDNVNRLQKFQNLANKYNNEINSTSNITAQKKIAQLRDQELEALKQIDHITEKDLERAEKKLDIIKAQIALEEAQKNKSQLRLRRDSQGNYRYQYVSDEEEVQKAQENLANAYNELYNFDKERYKNNLNDAYVAWNDYQEKMAEAALINDPEVRGERESLLTKEYNERILILTEENERIKQELNESTFAELNSLYAQNADNYDLMTEEQKQALGEYKTANQTAFDLVFGLYTENTEKFRDMTQDQINVIQNQMVPQWTSGYQALVDEITKEGGIEKVSAQLAEQLHNETEKYKQDLVEIEGAAGNTFDNISSFQNGIIENNAALIEDNQKVIDNYKTLTDGILGYYNQLRQMMQKYKEDAADAKTEAEKTYNYILTHNAQAAEEASKNVDNGPTTGGNSDAINNPTTPTTTTNNTTTSTPSTPTNASPQGNGSVEVGDYVTFSSGGLAVSSDKDASGKNSSYRGQKFYVQRIVGGATSPYHLGTSPNFNNSSSWMGWVKKSQISGYDTGGYTGSWNNNGRLAFLHQKELVLNKNDTSNMLNAIEVLRGITANIGTDILGKLASVNSMIGFGASGMLNQNVHIEATFPGVTSSLEIQDALNNLVNVAAQRAQVK